MDREGTARCVGLSLSRLLAGAGPAGSLDAQAGKGLSERGIRHLRDLAGLHRAMGGELPDDLSEIGSFLDAAAGRFSKRLVVYRREGMPRLSPWQRALLARVAAEEGDSRDPVLGALLEEVVTPPLPEDRGTALSHMQRYLFGAEVQKSTLDDSVQWIAARDFLEEAEVAAGMVQAAMANDAGLAPADFGLLVPADSGYAEAVRDVFGRAGLPLSGLCMDRAVRDLGREAVLSFLITRRKPAPVMALAALLTSPLMPWTEEEGNGLAREVMDGNFHPRPLPGFAGKAFRMLSLILSGAEKPETLARSLEEFGTLLELPGDLPARHLENAQEAPEDIMAALRAWAGTEVPWKELADRAAPRPPTAAGDSPLTREGIAVFSEREEPWQRVRRLIVLGFSEGRYPAGPEGSPVFHESDVRALKEEMGLDVETADDVLARRRALFRRQIGCAGERVTFLVPQRDALGKPLAPSGTLVFMAQLFEGVEEPKDLLLSLERASDRRRVKDLAEAPPKEPVPPRPSVIKDLALGRSLLVRADGSPRSETPSTLETLMVSPLAWILNREDLVPADWTTEELDPKTKGNLAHHVFEALFRPGKVLPPDSVIRSSVPRLLAEAFIKYCPFLHDEEWYVERRNLRRDVEEAALRWREILEQAGATVLGAEVGLSGMFDGLPVRGRADLLLGLPPGRLYVVDYKKSRRRRKHLCMTHGYDCQTSLYRIMLRTGGPSGKDAEAVARHLEGKDLSEIGVLYYLMDDQVVLADTAGWLGSRVPAAEELGDGISAKALALLGERLGELRAGRIALNRDGDEASFKNMGVPVYAFDASPLVRLFVLPRSEAEEVPT
jgi:ATP-dependent helicase/nuclease subunit B